MGQLTRSKSKLILLQPLQLTALNIVGLLAGLLLAALPAAGQATEPPDSLNPGSRYVRAQLIADQSNIQPAADSSRPSLRIGILLSIEDGWHTYWHNSGEAALPTKVDWLLPQDWKAGDLQWPAPLRVTEKGDITTFGYSKETLLWSDVFVPQIIPSEGGKATIKASLRFLVCRDVCVPGRQNLELEIPFSSQLAQGTSQHTALFESYAAVSPAPLSKLRMIPQLKHLQVAGVTEHNSTQPGSESRVALVFSGIEVPASADISTAMQIFPYRNDAINANAPTGFRRTQNDRTAELVSVLPVAFPASAKAGTINFRGIYVISKTALGTAHDIVGEWSLPLIIDAGTPIPNSHFTPFKNLIATATPLSLYTLNAADDSNAREVTASTHNGPLSFSGLLFALISAFIGGLILNLMPCVLPIVSIKILGFVNQKNQSRVVAISSSMFFALGILSTFLALAATIIVLRSLGHELAWGFQFHHPEFVLGLLLVVFLLSLGLFDLYSFQLPFMQIANRATGEVRSPHLKHFFDGVLATALSTPCTAPIFGTALVFAFAQPAYITVLVFLAIGLGLALPYVVLSCSPALMKYVPQPGNWMFRFRALMGFFLLGTVVWLLGVLQSLHPEGVVWTVLLLLIVYFAVWFRKSLREGSEGAEARTGLKTFPLVILVLLSSYVLAPKILGYRKPQSIDWKPFTQATLLERPSPGTALFIDFTADWCVTCKFNEYFILQSSGVIQAMKDYNITPIRADWTNGDVAITEALRSYGAEGVPFYVVIPPEGKAAITLSSLPTPSSLIDAFRRATTVTEETNHSR